jgi:outer membrane protein assembly factor BamB
VKAISIHDYTILWEFQIDVTRPGKNILSSIVDYGNTIIFWCYDGSLYMLDKIAGKPIKIMSISDWIGSTPCIEKTTEKIFVWMEQYGMMQWGIICLDKNLQPLWFYETSDYIHCSPLAIADTNTIVCGTNSWELLALTTDTGALLWRIQTMGAIKAWFCYIPEIQAICFGSFDKYIYCVDIISGKILWTIETKQIVFSTPIYLNGAIFIGCVDRRFYHIDIFGNILYQYETGGRIFATPVQYGDNYIVFGSNDMKLYFYNFIQKKMVLFIQHSERITTKPIFLNKKLYIEDFANRLFEYDLDSLTP